MKIYQIHKKYPGGGAAKIAADLHEGYQKLGHQVMMLVGQKTALTPEVVLNNRSSHRILDEYFGPLIVSFVGFVIKGLGLRRWKFIREWQADDLPRWNRLSKAWSDYFGYEYVGYRGIKDWENSTEEFPDIFQCHTIEGDYFDWSFLPKLGERSKVVLTMHNVWILTGLCHHTLGCDRWKIGCGECPQLPDYPQYRRDATNQNWRAKVDLFDLKNLYINTPCEWLMNQVNKSVIAEKVAGKKIIYNGIDEVIFSPADRFLVRQKLNLPLDSLILLFVGNKTVSNKWKRTDWMFEAIQELSKFVLQKKITFVMLGQEGEKSSIGDCDLFMVGHLNDPHQVAEYFQAADIYLHAALMDTFPNVVLEAMGCGLPIVATRVGGIPEQVLHGVNGFLSAPGNSQEMAGYLKQLIESESLRRTMGLASRKRVEDHFTKKQMVESYLEWFGEISGKA